MAEGRIADLSFLVAAKLIRLILTPSSTYGSVDLHMSKPPNRQSYKPMKNEQISKVIWACSRSVQLFMHSSPVYPTYSHTDTQTTLRATCGNRPHLMHCMQTMRSENVAVRNISNFTGWRNIRTSRVCLLIIPLTPFQRWFLILKTDLVSFITLSIARVEKS